MLARNHLCRITGTMRSTSSPNSLALQRKQTTCLPVRQRKKENGQDFFVMNTWISFICDSSLVMHYYTTDFSFCFIALLIEECPQLMVRAIVDIKED